jgi:hypothetical protein
VEDIDKEGAEYTVRIKSQPFSEEFPGLILFQLPNSVKNTGVRLKDDDEFPADNADVEDKRATAWIFGGDFDSITAALTDFLVLGTSAGLTGIIVEVSAVPLEEWRSSAQPGSVAELEVNVLPPPEGLDDAPLWRTVAIYGGFAAAVCLSFFCCWQCTRKAQERAVKRDRQKHGYHAGPQTPVQMDEVYDKDAPGTDAGYPSAQGQKGQQGQNAYEDDEGLDRL